MVRILTAGFVLMIFFLLAEMRDILVEWRESYDKERQTRSQGWTPRSIPSCDRELWERIREGCDDE
jgi:hypothetical protein